MSTDRRSLAALCLVLAAGAALGAGGCGSSSTAPAARAVSLTLSPDSAVITPGNQIAFHASARDSRGQPVSVTVHWAVGDTHVVAVDSAGVVVGRNEGRTTVEARTPTLRAVGTVRVIHTGSGVGQITVTPDPARYIAGDIQPFAAEVRDSAGGVLLMAVQWSVDHPAVAAVDSAGTVTCLAPGSAVVTAAAAGVRGTAQLTVVAAPQVSTAAGNGTPGTQDGAAAQASFNTPMGLAVDSLGAVYVADLGNNRIRVLENGQVRTLAGGSPGYADGVGTAASFLSPTGVAVGPGRRLYVADQGNHAIRRVDPDGTVTTVAGQPPYPGYLDSVPSEAMFRDPSGVAVTSAGHIFVADRGNSVIREVVPGDQVRTVCGTPGVPGFEDGTPGFMDEPFGLALGPDGTLYVCERGEGSSAVCRVSAQGALATLAGSGHPGSRGGPGPFGQFDQPMGITVAPDGWVYVADVNNRKVRSASPAGFVAQVAGSGLSGYLDGAGEASEWKYPSGVAWLASGDLLVTDALNHRLRLVHGGLHLTAPRWPPSALRLLLRPRVGAAPARAAVRALPPGVAPAPAARFGGRR